MQDSQSEGVEPKKIRCGDRISCTIQRDGYYAPVHLLGTKTQRTSIQRIDQLSIGGVMILRQLCVAIAPIEKIRAIAAPQPADLSSLDHN